MRFSKEKDLLLRSGGRSVILTISKKTIPLTSVPPLNSYALAFVFFFNRANRNFFFRFSVPPGFMGSSVSSDVSKSFSSSSSSSSSYAFPPPVPSFSLLVSSSSSPPGVEQDKLTKAESFSRISWGVAAGLLGSANANCNWTSPEITDPLDLALFCLDFNVYH